jgi:hypothetical protein
MATPKEKFSFSINGVKYTDIKGKIMSDILYINVGGTSQMILQWMKQKYPNIPKQNYYWIKSKPFANGNSIDVYLNNAPDTFANELKNELEAHFERSIKHYASQYSATKIADKTDEGQEISYGTKYFFLTNFTPSGVKSEDADWSILNQPTKTSKPMATKSSATKPSYAMGEVLKDCAGWVVSKKTLPDGRVVYNAKIKPDTPVNKDQWQEIKNEVYTQTGFKWGKFGAFEKWGVIASEAAVVDILCKILDKYYPTQSQTQAPLAQAQSQPQKPRNFMVGDKFYAKDYPDTKYYIKSVNSDGEVGFASLQRPDSESIYGTEDEVSELFEKGQWVKDGRYDYGQPTSEPQSPMSNGINESYKDLPANPKLEFCAINRAEGSYPDDLLPIRFQSFTALTKFIADNIGEMPPLGEGYDKYYISWKWKFEDEEESERWDVSEGDANPYKYPNLWAYNRLRNLCYDAWYDILTKSRTDEDDNYYADVVGKDGWEINSIQFMSLLGGIINLYPEDKKRFTYNTYKERFDRFAEAYPKLFKLFSDVMEESTNKEAIQKAINGLKYLADKGNEKAAKAIKGLQYLLNK